MSRVLTTYKQPSILAKLQNVQSVEELGVYRQLITQGLARDRLGSQEFVPDARTVAKWAQAQWESALRLILTAKTASECNYRYNYMFTWPKAQVTADQLELAYQLRARALPSPTEELLAQGITIEGVTKHEVRFVS